MAAGTSSLGDVWVVSVVSFWFMRLTTAVTVWFGNKCAVLAVSCVGYGTFVGWVFVLAAAVFRVVWRAISAVADRVVGGVAGSTRGFAAVRVIKIYLTVYKVLVLFTY